jgi:hypothetical protein
MQKIMLKLAGRYNFVVRLLLGKSCDIYDVESYDSFTGYRWGVTLNGTTRRTIKPIPDKLKEYNDFEKDLFRTLFINHSFHFLENKLV